MTQTTTIDAVARTTVIKRDRCEWVEHAYLGEVGSGTVVIHDDAGSIAVVGHKTIITEQSACASWPRLFTGFVGSKTFGRGETYQTGAGREIRVSTRDGNDLLARYVISGSDGNRPEETITDRVAWLVASDYLTGLVADHGNIAASALLMDKTDYRGQRPGDVLAACAKKAGFNYYVRWSASADFELVFRNDNTSTDDTSTITIINDGTANGTSSFAPFQDAELTEDPEDVYSGVYATYSKGADYFERPDTAAAFVARDGTTDDSGIKTEGALSDEATQFLDESDDEEHLLTVTLRMRAAYVNLIRPGQRVSVTMTHYATQGYDSATYFRVLRRRVTQPLDTDNDYDVALDLSPQEVPPTPDVCDDLYTETPSATYYPLGHGTDAYAPADSDGIVYYWRGGLAVPLVPTPGWPGGGVRTWHFPAYGAGGLGTIDYAGDCSGNRLILMTVGPGEWTIQTKLYGAARALEVKVGPTFSTTVHHSYITSGDAVTVTISDPTDGDCIRTVVISDRGLACGAKWGWSEGVWVAA